jgi:hypothetical protein
MPRRSVPGAFAALYGLLCILPAIAASADASTRYIDREYHYSLAPPPGWTRKTDMPRPYVAFLGPIEQEFQANFHVYSEPAANKTLAEYVKISKETITKNKKMRLVRSGKTRLAGVPAETFQLNVTVPGNGHTVTRQVVALRDGRGYILTFSALPKSIKKLTRIFDRVIASFRWER